MSHPAYQALIQLITQRMGWNIREPDLNNLYVKINQRMEALKLATLEGYCQFLEDRTKKSEYEWDKLIQLLTVGESY
ncbi:MAG: hypothetical protein VKJ46_07640, partial [Leptolyngbyaceae bacterium]|nr:hypothetical protein [Leptolyngbyaceae bacterium]